jgi:hypothetical protein
MTDRLRSALLIDNEGCVVPLHATFGEFLVDPEHCTNPLYRVNPSKGHAQLAFACIAAFTFEKISGYLPVDGDAPLMECVSYAKSGWDVHLRMAEVNDELKQQVMHLIGAQMPICMRPRGWSQGGVSASIERWLKVSTESHRVQLHTVFPDINICLIGFRRCGRDISRVRQIRGLQLAMVDKST